MSRVLIVLAMAMALMLGIAPDADAARHRLSNMADVFSTSGLGITQVKTECVSGLTLVSFVAIHPQGEHSLVTIWDGSPIPIATVADEEVVHNSPIYISVFVSRKPTVLTLRVNGMEDGDHLTKTIVTPMCPPLHHRQHHRIGAQA